MPFGAVEIDPLASGQFRAGRGQAEADATFHGFELRQIYASGAVVAASVVLTAAAWAIAAFVTR